MLNWLLLGASVVLGTSRHLFTKKVKNVSKNLTELLKANIFIYSVGFGVLYICYMLGGHIIIRGPLLLSFLYGLFTLLAQISLFLAVGNGPVSISTLFYSSGFIIPTIYGSIVYKETIGLLRIIGICLTVVAFVLSAKLSEAGKMSLKWLLFALGGMLFSGAVGVIQKVFGKVNVEYTLDGFLLLSFLLIIIMCICMLFLSRLVGSSHSQCDKPKNDWAFFRSFDKKFVASSSFLGAITGITNMLNTYLTNVFVSAISFPIINGGTIVFTALMSRILFGERLCARQYLGLILGGLAIIMIAIG